MLLQARSFPLAAAVAAVCSLGCTGTSPVTAESGAARAPSPKSVACADLAARPPAGVAIREAVADDDAPSCKVAGVIDGSIGFELLLPEAWNGKFLMGGGGGFVGSVQNSAMAEGLAGGNALERGYATAGTDTGHTGSGIDASWALNNPRAQEDFAHRSLHRTAEVSKQIIADYYVGDLQRSYFLGCSRGGGHALMLAQRYPDDFDGIISAAPAFDWPGMAAEFLRNQQAVFPDPKNVASPVITDDNRKLLAEGLRQSCDALDGVADGVLTDPRRCRFDPASLPVCPGAAAPDCLTREQLAAIQVVYADTVGGGDRLYPGLPFGGEADEGGWDRWITRAEPTPAPDMPNLHFALGVQFARYFVFADPSWSYANFDFTGWRQRTARQAELLNATSLDLHRFRARGGKLILWHGWSDSALPATRSIEYYESVERRDPKLRSYFALYMLPGVGHCTGGPGADRADWIATLEQWVEQGVAPSDLVATKKGPQGATLFERRLCPYPQVPKYDGKSDVNAASSYVCGAP
jgi:feruloyl esterase